MSSEYVKRTYRQITKASDLVGFEVKIQESDLFILAQKDLRKEAYEALTSYRKEIEDYILEDPEFKYALYPYKVKDNAPSIVKEMAYWAGKAGVGPMAGIAGAVSEFVGKNLLKYSSQIIVENGGDIFLSTKKERSVAIFAGKSPWSNKIGILVPEDVTLGICTSSGTVGPSLSFGKTDAVVIVADSTIFADALATAVGNMVKSSDDIPVGIDFAKNFPEVQEIIIIVDDKLGAWGKFEIIKF
ncbi:MAG: UPF0280 family protein [Dictyoglomaceae bacterium]|nr:UPF0280 family protein [Dictyoglomaceae bacterium]